MPESTKDCFRHAHACSHFPDVHSAWSELLRFSELNKAFGFCHKLSKAIRKRFSREQRLRCFIVKRALLVYHMHTDDYGIHQPAARSCPLQMHRCFLTYTRTGRLRKFAVFIASKYVNSTLIKPEIPSSKLAGRLRPRWVERCAGREKVSQQKGPHRLRS